MKPWLADSCIARGERHGVRRQSPAMNNANKKSEELGHLTNFLAAAGISGTPKPQPDGHGPDFLLETPLGEVGIEITELHREQPASGLGRRQMEGIREQVLEGARRLWEQQDGVPLEVHVHFIEQRTPFKQEINRVAGELVSFVQAHTPAVGQCVRVRRNDTDELPEGVHAVSVVRLPTHTRSFWSCPDADWEQMLSEQQVQTRISSKAQKLARYSAATRVVWLLIVLDSRRFSGWFDMKSPALASDYESMFARTFVFDRFSATVRELSTHPARADPAV